MLSVFYICTQFGMQVSCYVRDAKRKGDQNIGKLKLFITYSIENVQGRIVIATVIIESLVSQTA